jgi:hypothetical protein
MKYQITFFLLLAEEYMLPCINKQVLGVDCPGCGIQRAGHLLLQGEFWAAFKMYPAIYTILLLFGFLILDAFVKIKYANKISIALMVSTLVLILTNYILKFI